MPLTPEQKRRLYILGALLGALVLLAGAEYMGFFRMVDFYLYEDY